MTFAKAFILGLGLILSYSFGALAAEDSNTDIEGFNTPGMCFAAQDCMGEVVLEKVTRKYCIESRGSQSWWDLDRQTCINL